MIQNTSAKKGEIEFRKKLVKFQVNGSCSMEHELDGVETKRILKERMQNTLDKMKYLIDSGNLISPYIEIGAERCQRSLVMQNDLNLDGAAIDISFDMLNICEVYRKQFNKEKSPLRICCDAYNLPFDNDSIPFAFCFQTLHHFPDPSPIVKEIHRVLSAGGVFYFDEEPYKKGFHIPLYKRAKNYSSEFSNRSKIKRLLDHFFAEETCNEVDYGIIENDDITLKTWRNALIDFKKRDIRLNFAGKFETNFIRSNNLFKYLIAAILGGSIYGICKKDGNINNSNKASIIEKIICPTCLEAKIYSKLTISGTKCKCLECGTEYPVIENILFLFTIPKLKELYPEFHGKLK